jgi:hypothetical protein
MRRLTWVTVLAAAIWAGWLLALAHGLPPRARWELHQQRPPECWEGQDHYAYPVLGYLARARCGPWSTLEARP